MVQRLQLHLSQSHWPKQQQQKNQEATNDVRGLQIYMLRKRRGLLGAINLVLSLFMPSICVFALS